MAATRRGSGSSLIDHLRGAPERFEFVQAVRLLERAAERTLRDPDADQERRLGLDGDPHHEAVRLRAALELDFPAAELAGYESGENGPELLVTLLGLTGPSGVLPAFYSQIVMEALRDKNPAPRNFLDMFNHRALSFFVRAFEKYRLGLSFERSGREGADPIGGALLALVGLGQPSLRRRQAVPDATMAFYAGHFAHRPRTAGALARILSDYFEQPATIQQFQGRWAKLALGEQSRLGAAAQYSRLGVDAVLGSRVFDVQGSFRVGLGPLDHEEFLAFLPDAARMAELNALVRSYAGPAFSFDVQLTLKASEIPRLRLSARNPPRLGWNTWLPTTGAREDATDAVFAPAGL
jgi:type VI secretion system protein ImpH